MADPVQNIIIAERLKRLREQKLSERQIRKLIGKRMPEPKAQERRYMAFLGRQQRDINAQLLKALEPLIRDITNLRQDGLLEQIDGSFELIARFIIDLLDEAAILTGIGNQGQGIWDFNDRKYNNRIFNLLGFNAVPEEFKANISQSWVFENLKLIKNANTEQISKLETLFLRASRDGTRAESLLDDVKKVMKSSTRRAQLIARDQTTKLQGQIDMLKQRSAGITHYFWRTSQDERVRPQHEDREGNRYAWDDPPEGGHPGQAILCRCVAEPDVESLLGDLGVPEEGAEQAQSRAGRGTEARQTARSRLEIDLPTRPR